MKEYCPDDEIQKLESKFWNHKMVGSDTDGYTARFYELARLVPHMVTPESQRVNRYIWGLAPKIKPQDGLFKKKENARNKKMSNDQNKNRGRDDRNKRQRTRGNFALTVPEQGQGQRQASNERPRLNCFECEDPNHFRRNFLRMNRATTLGGNRPNPVLAIEGNTNRGTIGIEQQPSVIILSYEIEIASGVKVETNKIIRGCRLELEGHTFNINLIPFGYGSFDVIVGMDWLSNLRAKIVCYEKIVQIPLSNGDILKVHEEGNLKQLKTMKVNEPKLEEIHVVREFPGVFLKDLSGLPPSREVEFYIDLIPRAMPVAKSPYRLAPTKMQELRFIVIFSKIAKPLTVLTQKNKKFEWGDEQKNAFQTLKDMLCDAPILALPEGINDFVVYCDASNQEILKGLDKLETKKDGGLYLAERIWVLVYGNLRTLIMNEFHATSKCLTCSKVKVEHQKPSRLLQQPEIPKWKWENITMDFLNKLPRTSSEHDSIWVIVDRQTKSAHFLVVREDFKTERLARLYINEIVARHDVPVSVISNLDSYFTSRLWQLLQKALGTRLDLKFSYNNNYHSSVKCTLFEALYGRKCRTPIAWAEVGENKLIEPEIIQETTDKIVQIKERLTTIRDCQKSYADTWQKPLEFSVDDKVLHKVSPRKGMKCLADANLHVPLKEVNIDDKLYFIEEPMEIMDREVKKLKRRRIPIVKVHWNS
uniref:Reverse transcriptase domain-containing protein n=1 Tax=Tanacetum cinerariifolium TaxID=118510 RepID=A0A6L2J7F6_TANCI|nr:reverse transcriptase domain-containing protein [Tanacetum cinerariifolium]